MVSLAILLIIVTVFAESHFGSGPRVFPVRAFAFGTPIAIIALEVIGVDPIVIASVAFGVTLLQIGIFVVWRINLSRVVERGERVIGMPFAGTWWCAHGGPALGTNHHVPSEAQHYAYDFCGWPLLLELPLLITRTNQRFPAYGREIRSPIDGTIVAAHDGEPDGRPPRSDMRNGEIAGNYVVIESGGGFLFLAHLQPGSVRHAAGQRVAVGDVVGTCGNSGNSTQPHLHIHMQDTPDLRDGMGVPLAFRLENGTIGRPLRGDRIVGPR